MLTLHADKMRERKYKKKRMRDQNKDKTKKSLRLIVNTKNKKIK